MSVVDKATRVSVNDVVHSFCFLVRNPQYVGLDNFHWPFILQEGTPAPYRGGQKVAVLFEHYRYFVSYLLHRSPEGLTIRQGQYLLSALLSFTAEWEMQEFDLAAQLMEKYYKMGVGT